MSLPYAFVERCVRSFRQVAWIFLFFAAVIGGVELRGNAMFHSFPGLQLDSVMGGACFSCLPQAYCTKSVPCTAKGAVWYKIQGQGITQKFCYDFESAGGSGDGYQGCRTQNTQDCVKVWTCTNATCTTCGNPSTEQKDTECNFIPYAPCTVAPPG